MEVLVRSDSRSRMVESLVTVLVKMVLQALGEREEGESCDWLVRILCSDWLVRAMCSDWSTVTLDRTRMNVLQAESRNIGTVDSSLSWSVSTQVTLVPTLSLSMVSTSHQVSRAGHWPSQILPTMVGASGDILPCQVYSSLLRILRMYALIFIILINEKIVLRIVNQSEDSINSVNQ